MCILQYSFCYNKFSYYLHVNFPVTLGATWRQKNLLIFDHLIYDNLWNMVGTQLMCTECWMNVNIIKCMWKSRTWNLSQVYNNYINYNYGFIKSLNIWMKTERTAGKMRTAWVVGDGKNDFSCFWFLFIWLINHFGNKQYIREMLRILWDIMCSISMLFNCFYFLKIGWVWFFPMVT